MIHVLLGVFVCLFVCLSVLATVSSFWSAISLLRYVDNRIVSILKAYIERNNIQVELIQYRKHLDFIHVYFCKARDSMQYRPPNANKGVSKPTTSVPFVTV